jgi:hypothetical protein
MGWSLRFYENIFGCSCFLVLIVVHLCCKCTQVASRLLSASNGLVQRAAYATGGIVDVGQPTPLSHPEVLFPLSSEFLLLQELLVLLPKFGGILVC